MTVDKKRTAYRLLLLIVGQKNGEKAQAVFTKKGMPVQYHLHGVGTASGEFADMFGLGGVDKTVLMSALPKANAKEMLLDLREELYLGTPNSGVAFTLPLTGGSAGLIGLLQTMEKEDLQSEGEAMESNYTLVLALVNQGFSEEVMSAARSAGAGGGTVFHTRRVQGEPAHQFWGVSFQGEREVVMILAKKEAKCDIMKAIGERCGLQTEAQGLVLSLPVDGVAGLKKDDH